MRIRSLLVPIFAFILATCGVVAGADATPPGAGAPKLDPAAAQLLKKVARAYAALRSYQGEAHIRIRPAAGPSMASTVRFAMERPNRVALRVQSDQAVYEIVCDGKTLWRYLAERKGYTRTPAPARIDLLLQGGPLQGAVWRLFGRRPHAALLEKVRAADYLGTEDAGKETHYHVRLHQGDATVDLWIDAADLLVRRLRAVSRDAAGREATIEEGHIPLLVNKRLPRSVFVFRKPPGAVEVKSFGPASLKGSTLPDAVLRTLGGKKTRLSSLRGRPLVLGFWNPASEASLRFLGVMHELHAAYAARGMEFVMVSVGGTDASATDRAKEKGWRFTIARDANGAVARKFAVDAIPVAFLVARNGVVRYIHYGNPTDRDAFRTLLRKQLDDLLAGKTE